MSTRFVSQPLQALGRQWLLKNSHPLAKAELMESAIVFAPHPDDETLGCGGTILRKQQAGAEVKIVFVTDGSRSHKRLMSEQALRGIRMEEAQAAGQALGLVEKDLIFLDVKEGELRSNQDRAGDKVCQILAEYQPNQVFVPHYQEPPLDHRMTQRIVLKTLADLNRPVTVFEYPIWLWRHWPWTDISWRTYRHPLAGIRHNLVLLYHLLGELTTRHFVGDLLGQKQAALAQHNSQMTRLLPSPEWLTLSDVSDGAFLQCFFQDHEYFFRYAWMDKIGPG
ncbi:MAG: PIG-L family deacetylase [Chloroflexota bacterium]